MLGRPVAAVAQRIDMLGQVDRVPERFRGRGTGGDEGEVEYGKVSHGAEASFPAQADKVQPDIAGRRPRRHVWEAPRDAIVVIGAIPMAEKYYSIEIYKLIVDQDE